MEEVGRQRAFVEEEVRCGVDWVAASSEKTL